MAYDRIYSSKSHGGFFEEVDTVGQKIKYCANMTFLALGTSVIALLTLIYGFGIRNLSQNTGSRSQIEQLTFGSSGIAKLLSLVFILALLAALEEIVFRFFPVFFCLAVIHCIGHLFSYRSSWGKVLIWPKVLFLIPASIVFGYLHGNEYNILMQGVAGGIFSMVFLRCGGVSNKLIRATFWSSLTHMAFNSILIGISIAFTVLWG